MSTLAEFRSRVRSQGGYAADDTAVTDARLNEAINRALRQIALEHDWPWLEKGAVLFTAEDTAYNALPSDFLRAISVRGPRGTLLPLRNPEEVEGWTGHGLPGVFAIRGTRILWGPSANGEHEFTLRYVRQEEILVNDSDTPLIPTYWDDGVVELALHYICRRVKDTDGAATALAGYGQWLAASRDNLRQTKASARIRVRSGSWI